MTTARIYGSAVKGKRRAEDTALQEAVEALRQVRNNSERASEVIEAEEDVYGKYIATQLKSLRSQPRLALLTRHKIEQVLFDARMELMPAALQDSRSLQHQQHVEHGTEVTGATSSSSSMQLTAPTPPSVSNMRGTEVTGATSSSSFIQLTAPTPPSVSNMAWQSHDFASESYCQPYYYNMNSGSQELPGAEYSNSSSMQAVAHALGTLQDLYDSY